MQNDSLTGLEPKAVARLVGITLDTEPSDKDRADVDIAEFLEAVLRETWPVDHRQGGAWPHVIARLLGNHGAGGRRCLGDLLVSPQSTLGAITKIRRHAKDAAARAQGETERTMMTTIYFAAIANGLVVHGTKITSYSYESLRSSFGKLHAKPWMSRDLVELFRKAEQVCRDRIQAPESP